jgi:hypothetical protein
MAYYQKRTDKSPDKTPDKKKVKKTKESKPEDFRPGIKESQWWRAAEFGLEPHKRLEDIYRKMEDDQQGRYQAYKEYERLFGATVSPTGDTSFAGLATDEFTQNELQSTIETLWAQIFKNRVAPAVSASEADWEVLHRAKGYSRWLEGAFDQAKVYDEVMPYAGMCMLTHGTGLARVGWKECEEHMGQTEDSDDDSDKEPDGDEPKETKYAEVTCWPVNPRYFLVDKIEARHGKPRNFFFKDHVDRYVLFDTYKDDVDGFFGSAKDRCDAIMKATANNDTEVYAYTSSSSDMITVREVFRIPSGPGAGDGRHVIWIQNCTLVDEPYTWDRPPMVVMRYGMSFEGFYGESAVKRLAPSQKRLDKLNKKIDESQDIMCVPRVLVRSNIGLRKAHVDDIPGGILEVDDINGVRDWNAQAATPELYGDRDSLGAKMRQLLGVSDFEAQQTLPERMREMSAPALERLVEQGTARNAMTHAQYEAAIVDLAYLFAYQAEELAEKGYSVVVKAPPEDSGMKTSIETLDFSKVCIDRKMMKIRVQPMSQLPQTFTGKVDAIEKLRNAQVPLNDKTALRMLEIPDVANTQDMMVSPEEIIFKTLSTMVRRKEYLPPLPFDNLDLIVRMTTDYINLYRIRDDADNKVVGLLSQYIDDAIALKKGMGGDDPNAPPPMPVPGAPGLPMGPMGQGGPPMPPPGMPMGPGPGMAGPMAGPPGAPMPPLPGPMQG